MLLIEQNDKKYFAYMRKIFWDSVYSDINNSVGIPRYFMDDDYREKLKEQK